MKLLSILFLWIGVMAICHPLHAQNAIYVCNTAGQVLRYDLAAHTYRYVQGFPGNNQDIACDAGGRFYGSVELAMDLWQDSLLVLIRSDAYGTYIYSVNKSEAVGDHYKGYTACLSYRNLGSLPVAAAGDICFLSPATAYYSAIDNHVYELTFGPGLDTLLAVDDRGQVAGMGQLFGMARISLTGCASRAALLCFDVHRVSLVDPATGNVKFLSSNDSIFVLGAASWGDAAMPDPWPQVQAINLVTPNGDGRNDALAFSYPMDRQGFRIDIRNRYGNLVFSSGDPAFLWPEPSSAPLPGIYYYSLSYQADCVPPSRQQGWVEVAR